ncbi:MAG: FAD-dependent oxidoreductase [Candidatus Neomarinimicrobiota bacterium]
MESQKQLFDSIIIGGGIGGSASALRSGQNGLRSLWLLGSKATRKRSRSQWVKNLDNMVGFHEDIIKDQVIDTLKRADHLSAAELIHNTHYHINNRRIIQNTINRIKEGFPDIEIVDEEAISLKTEEGVFTVKTSSAQYRANAVILATGVMDKQPVIKQEDRFGAMVETLRWIYPFANREQALYCIRCEGHLTRNESVAIIGNTRSGAELAKILYERYKHNVYLLTNGTEPDYSEESIKIMNAYAVKIIKSPIVGVLSEGSKQLKGFKFKNQKSIEVKFALISLGLFRVYNDLAREVGARLMDAGQPDEKRHIQINQKGETSIPNLFVVGDAAKREDEPVMKQVYTAQEYAVRAVDVIDYRRRLRIRKQILHP